MRIQHSSTCNISIFQQLSYKPFDSEECYTKHDDYHKLKRHCTEVEVSVIVSIANPFFILYTGTFSVLTIPTLCTAVNKVCQSTEQADYPAPAHKLKHTRTEAETFFRFGGIFVKFSCISVVLFLIIEDFILPCFFCHRS